MGQHENSEVSTRLIQAAERCFNKKGVAHTSMLDIAAEAEVSRTTLYKYYPRIENILQEAFVLEFDRFEDKIQKKLLKCRLPEERLLELVIGISENVPRSRWISTLVGGPKTRTEEKALDEGRAALDERIYRLIDEPLEEMSVNGSLRTDVDREMVIEWIRVLVHAYSVVRHPGEHSRGQRRKLISQFLLPSIVRPEYKAAEFPGRQKAARL